MLVGLPPNNARDLPPDQSTSRQATSLAAAQWYITVLVPEGLTRYNVAVPTLACWLSNEVAAEYSASVQPDPADASGPPDRATCVLVPGAGPPLVAGPEATLVEAQPAAGRTASAGSAVNLSHFLPRSIRVPMATPRQF